MTFPILRALRRRVLNIIDPKGDFSNPFNESFLWGSGGGYTQYDSSNITYIEQGYNINPTVFAVVNQMATKTANVPYYIRKIDDKQAKARYDSLRNATRGEATLIQKIRLKLLERKAFSKEDLPFPMDRPNAYQTWTEWHGLYKTMLKCTGNVYLYTLAPEEGPLKNQPMQIYILPSQYIQIILKPNANMLGIESPVLAYHLVYGKSYTDFKATEVIHIKYSNPNYGENGEHLYGQSPLRSGLKNIQSTNEALDLNNKTLRSGGAFGLIHGKQVALTVAQAKELKERLKEMDKNPERLAKMAGISAEVGFTRLSLTSEELKPFDYLRFDTKTICNILIWSDKLLNNDDGAKYDNVNQFRKQVVTDNIEPDLNLLAAALNESFIKRFKGYENSEIYYDVMELPEMQEDIKETTEWLNNALDRGVIVRNEYRDTIGLVERKEKEMEIPTVKDDIISLEDALNNDFL